ncbi:hypothetical protein JCM10908_001938 [Rhodotorula pacifica]|uniref:Avt1p n=1 Tax=Rhodotorula pacifica TaxID=1495444 RepID=UPI00316B236E
MTSRRIPISSSSAANSRRPSHAAAAAEPTRYASSLDAVFSFQRSAAFFGDNLQTGPSFVDRSRYPKPFDDGDDEEDDVGAPAAGGRPHWNAMTTDEDNDELDDDDGEEEAGTTSAASSRIVGHSGMTSSSRAGPTTGEDSQDSDSGSGIPSGLLVDSSTATTTTTTNDSLPPNAVARSGRRRHDGAAATAGASERSPLLSRTRTRNNRNGDMFQVGGDTSASSADYLSTKAGDSSSGVIYSQDHARRPSVFSREAWKAKIEETRGESTWGQTLFNTVNVLIGVGLLADPLAFADAGWVFGTLLLLFCALVTNYTAKMLAAMMRQDRHALTYADVLISAYGTWSRPVILALFVLELSTFSVATVELFADSMASLYPVVSPFTFKLVSYIILVPTTFLPLRILSLTSLLGIMSSFVLLAVIAADGFIKREAPGSLWEVMPTSFEPRWRRFPLSFGLLMSGFSGHAVVPSLYRDMAQPTSFNSMIDVAYIITFIVTMLFAAMGYLMFGNGVSSEITRDLARTAGYPVALNKLAVWMVAINPLVKYAIANKPLVHTFEHLVGSVSHTPPPPPESESESAAIMTASTISNVPPPSPAAARRARILRYVLYRPLLTLGCVGVAILIPEFDRVLAFLGSASAFVICVIGPVGAYLIVGRKRPSLLSSDEDGLSRRDGSNRKKARRDEDDTKLVVDGKERVLCWFLLILSAVMASTGTVWSFLPLDRPDA